MLREQHRSSTVVPRGGRATATAGHRCGSREDTGGEQPFVRFSARGGEAGRGGGGGRGRGGAGRGSARRAWTGRHGRTSGPVRRSPALATGDQGLDCSVKMADAA